MASEPGYWKAGVPYDSDEYRAYRRDRRQRVTAAGLLSLEQMERDLENPFTDLATEFAKDLQ
jgi:hypothetical protein